MELFENEEFVPIKGFENYEISQSGKVRTVKTKRIRKNFIDRRGYLFLQLFRGGEHKGMLVHRLIALHFIPNPNNYPQINHKDGNKLNNNIENLEWCTNSQNIKHAYLTGLRVGNGPKGEKSPNSKLTEKQVTQIMCELKQGVLQKEIAKTYGVSEKLISNIKYGKTWKHVTI